MTKKMQQALADEGQIRGLKMNKSKIKVMKENDTPTTHVNITHMENVESYVYLGQRYNTRDKERSSATSSRVTLEPA